MSPVRPTSIAALAPPKRREVLQVLTEAGEPLGVREVAERLGLHMTTARFHLNQLQSVGLVESRTESTKRRGRPKDLYSPLGAARDESAREQLIGVLAAAIATQESHQQLAEQAGHQWANTLPLTRGGSDIDVLIEVLNRLGFAPEAMGEAIDLNACPFRGAAHAHPEIVCTVHRGLIDRVLERTGTQTQAQLTPFVEDHQCVVELTALNPQSPASTEG